MKTTYQRWFIEFEFPNEEGKPYKSSGGKMVWNEELKREIPDKWIITSIKKFVTKDTRKYESYNLAKTIDLSVMPSSSISLNDINTSDKFTSNLNIMEEGNILFGSIRPYLKKAGIAPCNGAVAGTVYSYKVIDESFYNFILIALTNDRIFDFALSRAKGTRMPVISSDDLLSYKVAFDEEIAKKFNLLNAKTIICKNVQENQRLGELKEFLLPLLMNGQINVDDIEI